MNRIPRLAPALALALATAACTLGGQVSPSTDPTVSQKPSLSIAPSATPEASDGTSAAPSASATAAPTPSGDLAAFVVAPNPAADALFLDRDQCQNADDGYRLEFPDDWWTNTAVGSLGPCSWFAPASYQVNDPSEPPSEVAIIVEYLEGDSGSFEHEMSREFGIVGGTQVAVRVEYQGAAGNGGQKPADWREYVYLVQLGPTEEQGPNIVIRTDTDMAGDYELNKAVMDRMVATMELLGTIQ